MSYEIAWKQASDTPTPEEAIHGVSGRQEAVEHILDSAGINLDDVEFLPTRRHLSEDPQTFYEVASLAIDNVETFIIIYQFLAGNDSTKLVLSEDAKELLDRLREEDEVEIEVEE